MPASVRRSAKPIMILLFDCSSSVRYILLRNGLALVFDIMNVAVPEKFTILQFQLWLGARIRY